MDLNLLKQLGVIGLAGINGLLAVWAVIALRQKRALPDRYYRLLPVSPAVAAMQLLIGLFFVVEGRQPHLMHIFYGVLVGTGAILQLLMRPSLATGQKYRNKPIVHIALALFVGLLSARSWMSG